MLRFEEKHLNPSRKIEIQRKLPQAIILCPTRELCLQISKDMLSYSKYIKGLKVTPVYGGTSITPQIKHLKSGTQIIVGTPGRVIDLINRKALRLKDIEYVILDEADEMLNMGFKEDIDQILSFTPKERVTWLFSATMPKEIRRIVTKYMRTPVEVSVNSKVQINKDISHKYVITKSSNTYSR